ncbi:putative fatty acid-binding protein 2, liver [Apostichopus japonicus]|uniref:Putative fatty acid-binding protein 2, liver n=1 Tax=Stichopus japonicus TaxID=307972 RepID=A0A2G8KMZ8_STIJA|nr:putative fatty acid-binding protein 2, liver [Apostichopus japonicus]
MPGAALNGKWVFDHGEGMDAVVKALNVPADKIPQDTNSTVDIKVNGDNITITTSFGGKTAESQMVIGQARAATELSRLSGKDVTGTPSWDGDKLVIQGAGGKGKIIREVVGGKLQVTFQFGDVSGKRIFNKA